MGSTNYRSDFFEFETLTPIIGKPDYQSLKRLKDQIKANAQAVPSTLGGGQHGLLGLVLSDVEYALASATPFVEEPYPGNLHLPQGTSAIQSKMIEDLYKKSMQKYNMCVGVKKAIIQQIVKAIHEDWLNPLRNQTTNMIQGTIPIILQFLFTAHGNISPDALIAKEQTVKDMLYDPETEPIDNVFKNIENLVTFATAAGAPYTKSQIINLAYVIIKRLRVFNSAITDWNKTVRVTPNTNTWTNFKTFFRQAYEELREVGDLKVADTTFNHANLVTQIVDAVHQSFNQHHVDNPEPFQQEPVQHFTAPQANNTNTYAPPLVAPTPAPSAVPDIDPMAAIVQQMMLMNTNLITSMQNSNTSGGRGNGRGGRGRGRYSGSGRGYGRGRSTRPRVNRYCWSCGWCSHDGEHCRNQKVGHKPEATLENRLGGSNDGFPPGSN